MTYTSPLNKEITPRDLEILQKLYRSREFKNKLTSFTPSNMVNVPRTFLVYGAINTLSSNQRRAFRNHLKKTTDFPNIKVKLSLFSSKVAHYITGYSSMLKLENLLKGTTYQIVLTVNNLSEEAAQAQFLAFLTYIKTLKFADDIVFNFNPTIRFPSPSSNKSEEAIAPRRVNQLKSLASCNIEKKSQVISGLIGTINSAYSTLIVL